MRQGSAQSKGQETNPVMNLLTHTNIHSSSTSEFFVARNMNANELSKRFYKTTFQSQRFQEAIFQLQYSVPCKSISCLLFLRFVRGDMICRYIYATALLFFNTSSVTAFSNALFQETPSQQITAPSKTDGVDIELPDFDELFERIRKISPLANCVIHQQQQGDSNPRRGFAAAESCMLSDVTTAIKEHLRPPSFLPGHLVFIFRY